MSISPRSRIYTPSNILLQTEGLLNVHNAARGYKARRCSRTKPAPLNVDLSAYGFRDSRRSQAASFQQKHPVIASEKPVPGFFLAYATLTSGMVGKIEKGSPIIVTAYL